MVLGGLWSHTRRVGRVGYKRVQQLGQSEPPTSPQRGCVEMKTWQVGEDLKTSSPGIDLELVPRRMRKTSYLLL